MGACQEESTPYAPDFSFETSLWESGYRFIAGVDEAGRGALAGPVSAGVLILPHEPEIQLQLRGMYDSKKLTPAKREKYFGIIVEVALAYAIGFSSAIEIDRAGILPATRMAMLSAFAQLQLTPDHLLVDFISIPECAIPQTSIAKGDERSLSIAGASILAKVARDGLMRQLDQVYPGYGFANHKGYGTLAHRTALSRLGPCPEHRTSFAWTNPSP